MTAVPVREAVRVARAVAEGGTAEMTDLAATVPNRAEAAEVGEAAATIVPSRIGRR